MMKPVDESNKEMKNKMKKIEDEMALVEKQKETIEHAMFEPDYYKNSARVATDAKKASEYKTKLEELYYSWSRASEELEKIV